MSNFWRLIDLLLIECEIGLHLKWKKKFVISEVSRTFRGVDPNANPVVCPVETETTGAIFQLNNAKLYVPVVTLSINDNIKFLKNIKQGLNNRSEIKTQPKNNNLSD